MKIQKVPDELGQRERAFLVMNDTTMETVGNHIEVALDTKMDSYGNITLPEMDSYGNITSPEGTVGQ